MEAGESVTMKYKGFRINAGIVEIIDKDGNLWEHAFSIKDAKQKINEFLQEDME